MESRRVARWLWRPSFAGFTIACTTAERLVSDRSDRLALPRFQVLDWGGDEFQARLRSWRDEAQDG